MADELYDKGMKIRREVLGDKHVDRSLANADDFGNIIQYHATANAWGTVWGREGLDRRSRSILNLGMLSALGKEHELKVHIKGALRNGLTREELGEIFLQVAIYCGVPASIECFRHAKDVFADIDANGMD